MSSSGVVDVVIFGATGYTGSRVVREFLQQTATKGSVSLGLAGRSKTKLEGVAAALGCPSARIIIADVKDEVSLRNMAQSCRLLINTVGPFRFYGKPVVRACIEAGTDYLDVCGEPEFMEEMEYEYHDMAKARGCLIVSAMGFDSVPADFGTYLAFKACIGSKQQTPHSPQHMSLQCTSVETFIEIHGGSSGIAGHFPTFESAVYGFASAKNLSALRRKAAARVTYQPPKSTEFPKLRLQKPGTYDPRIQKIVVPFMGSCPSVVRRTILRNAARGSPFFRSAIYVCAPSRWAFFLLMLYGIVFSFLARFVWGRRLLLRYPGFFSHGVFTHEGPSEQQLQDTSFKMTFLATGYASQSGTTPTSNRYQSTLIIKGPEPGYISCSIFIVAAALMLIEEREQLHCSPGVLTPALLLGESPTYVERLKARGITFKYST